MSRDKIAHLRALLAVHRRTHRQLELQAAQFSVGYVPVHLLNGITDALGRIETTEAQLRTLCEDPATVSDADIPPGEVPEFAAPPDRMQTDTSPTLNLLPRPDGQFLGREAEYVQLVTAMTPHPTCPSPLAAVVGMGGLGKTQLVLHVAHAVASLYSDGVIFLEVHATEASQVRTVVDALQDVVRLFVGLEVPLSADRTSLTLLYRKTLAGKHVLLVLDDVRDAALITVLQSAPGCALLITTREQLALGMTFSLALTTLARPAARALLLERAPRLATAPELETLLDRCGDIPLTLRVVGATLADRPQLPLAAYLARLARPEARESMLAHGQVRVLELLGASETLLANEDLPAAERWRMLGVCAAPFPSEAAQTIWNEADPFDTDTLLIRLTHASLLSYEPTSHCYSMHDLLRDVAHLRSTPLATVLAMERYAQWVISRVQMITAADSPLLMLLHQLDSHWAHIRSIERWAAQEPLSAAAAQVWLDLVLILGELMEVRLTPQVALTWLARARQASQRLSQLGAEARILRHQGNLYRELQQPVQAEAAYTTAVTLARQVGDTRTEGRILGDLGSAYREKGAIAEATVTYQASLTCAQACGDQYGIASAIGRLGTLAYWRNDLDLASTCYHERLALAQALGDSRMEAKVRGNLGLVASGRGDDPEARRCFEEAITLAQALGDRYTEARNSWNYANHLMNRDDYDAAAAHMGIYLLYAEATGLPATDIAQDRALLTWVEEQAAAARQQQETDP